MDHRLLLSAIVDMLLRSCILAHHQLERMPPTSAGVAAFLGSQRMRKFAPEEAAA